jgi:hypothetical protein
VTPALVDQLRDAGLTWLADTLDRILASKAIEAADLPAITRALDWAADRAAVKAGPPRLPAKQLAEWTGCSLQKLGRMTRDTAHYPGLPRLAAGGYPLDQVCRWLMDRATELIGAHARLDKLNATADEHKHVKLESEQVNLAARKGLLIDKAAVDVRQVQQVHRVRTELERLPGTVARKLGLGTEHEETIRRECERICNRFAQG